MPRLSCRSDVHPCRRHRSGPEGDEGFTLIELLVVVLVLPLVVGAISVAMIAVFKLQTGVSNRISGSGDAQIASANFVRDVQNAATITTLSTPQCGSGGTEVLGLTWGSTPTTTVSYVVVAEGTSYSLFRRLCQGTTLTGTSVVSSDLPTVSAAATTISCASTVAGCHSSPTQLVSAAGVAGVSLAVTTAGSFQYNLSAVPRAWTPLSGGVAAGGVPVLPLQLLGAASCSSPILSIVGGSSVVVNGSLTVATPCAGAISLSGGSSITATSILTPNADSPLDTVTPLAGSPTEVHVASALTDPFAALTPPTPPSASTVTCSGSTCGPGDYASFPTSATVSFSSGTYVFDALSGNAPVTISNGRTVTFGSGTYWFKSGLSIVGGSNVSFGTGTYIFGVPSMVNPTVGLSFSNGAQLSFATTAAGGNLFYIAGGSFTIAGGVTTSMFPSQGYDGVTIWDAGASGTTNPIVVSNGASSTFSLGGIYAPSGVVTISGGGSITAAFLLAASASLSNGTTFNLG